uniref:Putative disease resistance protein At4g27220 n=1 Tax=Rhizophora mucronata TaxID=61149 RepID=A0A2P2M5S5_RHIMU
MKSRLQNLLSFGRPLSFSCSSLGNVILLIVSPSAAITPSISVHSHISSLLSCPRFLTIAEVNK